MYRSLSFWGKRGSSLTARARLVSGPRATKETCGRHVLAVHHHQRAAADYRQTTARPLTWFWFSDTSLINALAASSFWIFSSHFGSLSSITSPSPSPPKWSVLEWLSLTRETPQPRNTGICRKKRSHWCSFYWDFSVDIHDVRHTLIIGQFNPYSSCILIIKCHHVLINSLCFLNTTVTKWTIKSFLGYLVSFCCLFTWVNNRLTTAVIFLWSLKWMIQSKISWKWSPNSIDCWGLM